MFEQIARWSMENQPPVSAESAALNPCDFGLVYPDPEQPGQYVLCERACMEAKRWEQDALVEYAACTRMLGDAGMP